MLLLLILLPMVLASLGYCLLGRRSSDRFYMLSLLGAFAEFLLSLYVVLGADTRMAVPLLCDLGLTLELDGFRKIYVLILAFMWLLTLALSRDYFRGHHRLSRYYFFILMTLGATMGVFLAGDLYTAFVFFEIMSFTSFPWVIQEETEGAIRAANTYLAVAVIGGLTALMGIFLLHHELGTTALPELYEAISRAEHPGVLYVSGGCILFGFGAKAGMFPLHIWLPKAHPVAPAPASALLSGALTKSGVWGVLALSSYVFRNDPAWGTLILCLGCVTMLLGAVLALFSVDLKRTLACSSLSQIGFILVGVGMMGLLGEENALAARGTLLHMVNHSLFKLLLFMCAGVVYMNTHTLDLTALKGFGRGKPFLLVCFLLGAAGIAGIPGLNGYISKTLLHESIVEGAALYGMGLKVVEWVFLLSGGLTLAYMTKLFVCLFVEKGKAGEHGKGRYMSPLSTAALGLSAALLPAPGLTANRSMNALADLGTDFFRSGALEETVRYYSLGNLKGGLISIVIGVVIYLAVVRPWMLRDGVYLDRWPKGLDLEERLYRPLLLKWLPTLFGGVSRLFADNVVTGAAARGLFRASGVLSRAVCDLPDACILLLRKSLYRPSRIPDPDKYHRTLSYRIGDVVDHVEERKYGTPKRGEHGYARLYYRMMTTFLKTTHYMADSVSFALLLLSAAICAILIYVLALRG